MLATIIVLSILVVLLITYVILVSLQKKKILTKLIKKELMIFSLPYYQTDGKRKLMTLMNITNASTKVE